MQHPELQSNCDILVCLGDFGQIPGPSSVLFGLRVRVRVLRLPRTPPFFSSPAKKGGGTAARAARTRARRARQNTPALQRYYLISQSAFFANLNLGMY
jgi:hypothetical protein